MTYTFAIHPMTYTFAIHPMTYGFAVLELSPDAYDEFVARDDGRELVDMHGIAVGAETTEASDGAR